MAKRKNKTKRNVFIAIIIIVALVSIFMLGLQQTAFDENLGTQFQYADDSDGFTLKSLFVKDGFIYMEKEYKPVRHYIK